MLKLQPPHHLGTHQSHHLSSLGAEAITAEASLALYIFEQGSNQAQRNNSLLQCLKSLATGQVTSKRVFNRRSKGK